MLLLISTTSPTHRDHPPNGIVCAQWDARATHTPHSLLQLRNSNTTPTPTTKMTSSNYYESLHSIYGIHQSTYTCCTTSMTTTQQSTSIP